MIMFFFEQLFFIGLLDFTFPTNKNGRNFVFGYFELFAFRHKIRKHK